jgi:hypothetical protein
MLCLFAMQIGARAVLTLELSKKVTNEKGLIHFREVTLRDNISEEASVESIIIVNIVGTAGTESLSKIAQNACTNARRKMNSSLSMTNATEPIAPISWLSYSLD